MKIDLSFKTEPTVQPSSNNAIKLKLLALDPGISTGWAILTVDESKKIQIVDFGILRKDLTLTGIQNHFRDVNLVVCESFLTRPKDARKGAFDWDPMETSQVIGAAKVIARQHDLQFVEQNASVKPVGYGYIGRVYKKGKKEQHAWDAIVHGVYYLVRNGLGLPFAHG